MSLFYLNSLFIGNGDTCSANSCDFLFGDSCCRPLDLGSYKQKRSKHGMNLEAAFKVRSPAKCCKASGIATSCPWPWSCVVTYKTAVRSGMRWNIPRALVDEVSSLSFSLSSGLTRDPQGNGRVSQSICAPKCCLRLKNVLLCRYMWPFFICRRFTESISSIL